MNCKNCNAIMKVDTENKFYICPYCNATEPFDSTSKEEIGELLKDAIKDVDQESRKMMQDMMDKHQRKMALANEEKNSTNVAIYVMLTVAVCLTMIMALFGLTTEYKASGVVALIQFGLLMGSFILKATAQKDHGKKHMSVVANWCMIAAALMVLVWFVAILVQPDPSSNKSGKNEIYEGDYYWPEEGFAEVVPRWGEQPDYAFVDDHLFHATILDATNEIFAQYVEKCKQEGFNVDVTEDATNFCGYDKAGNELNLSYLQNVEDHPIYIKMYKALEFAPLIWPAQGNLKEVPTPDSEEMMVETMPSDYFSAYVNDMPQEKFIDYIQQCVDAGFDGKYEKGSNTFYGDKIVGDKTIKLSLELKRNRVMQITVY